MRNIDVLCSENRSAKMALGQIGIDCHVLPIDTVSDAQDFVAQNRNRFGWTDDITLIEAVADWLLAEAN